MGEKFCRADYAPKDADANVQAPNPVSSSSNACRPWLMRVSTTRKMTTTKSTVPVDYNTLGKVGQVTLLSSEKVSLSFLPILTNKLGF